MICKECKAEINGNICDNCGYKNISPKKKVIALTAIAVLLIAVIISLTLIFVKESENRKIEICVTKGQAFSELINNSKRNMENIGMFYSASTKMNYGYSWNEEYFTNYVTDLNSDWISKEKANMLNIKSQYESIEEIKYNNDDIKNFQKQSENLYNAYEDMYDLLIEQNFTYKNFETKYSQYKNEFNMALELYNSVLEELNVNK